MILVFFRWLWVEGLTLYPFVFLKEKQPPDWLLNHERIHIKQQLEMGVIPFYVWYLVEYLLHRLRGKSSYWAYRAISFEKEAYRNHDDLAYLKTRRFWGFLKYL